MYLKNIKLGRNVRRSFAETISTSSDTITGPYDRVRNGLEVRQSRVPTQGGAGDQQLSFSTLALTMSQTLSVTRMDGVMFELDLRPLCIKFQSSE